MNNRLTDRRHPYGVDLQGERFLAGKIDHDRRRRQVVEDLLSAMRIRAQVAGAPHEGHEPANKHAPLRRRYWRAMALFVISFILIALVARWAEYPSPARSQGVCIATLYKCYEWLGFHRVPLSIP